MSRVVLHRLSLVRGIIHHIPRPSQPSHSYPSLRYLATSPDFSRSQTTQSPATDGPTDRSLPDETPVNEAFSLNLVQPSPSAQPGVHSSVIPPSQSDMSSQQSRLIEPNEESGNSVKATTDEADVSDSVDIVREVGATSESLHSESSTTAFSRLLGGAKSNPDPVHSGSETVVDVAEKSSSTFVDVLLSPAMSMLNGVHDITGLPWWMSIGLATFAIRGVLLPFTLMTMKNSALMQALKNDVDIHRKGVMDAARSGDRQLAHARQKEMQEFMSKAGVAPMRVLLGPLVQFPVFISFFVSIRRLATNDPTLQTGGTAWFTDLSVMDPFYILPVICGVTLFAMTEIGGDSGSTKMTPQMRLFMRSIAVLSVPMTYWFPAAVFCYWIPNNLISISLGACMRMPIARRLLGMQIDPANIAGTRANRQLLARMALQGKQAIHNLDPAVAAKTYSKKSSVMSKGEKLVKPVLFKTKPSKKVKDNTQ